MRIIYNYRNSCPQFFSETDRETEIYKEYCHPEKEVYCEVSNRSEQTLLDARYLQQTNNAAQQEDSGETTRNKETTADTDRKVNDDIVVKVNTKGYTSGDNENISKYNTVDNSVKSASDMNDANQMREAGAKEEGCKISILLEKTPQ